MIFVKSVMAYDKSYSSNEHKMNIRGQLIQHMSERTKRGDVIATLPALNFELENVAVETGLRVRTIEVVPEVYAEQRRLCAGVKGITNYNETALEFFSKRPYLKYAFVYLDYCSQWSREIAATMEYMTTPTLAITLLMRWESHPIFKLMSRDNAYEQLFRHYGYNIVQQFKYTGGVNSPMSTFILHKLDYNAIK